MIALQTLGNKVEFILEHYEETRNSDVALMVKIWREYHNVGDYIPVDRLYDLPRLDVISRIRRHIQKDEGKFPPTSWEVAHSRGWLETEWKKALGYYIEPKGQYKLQL